MNKIIVLLGILVLCTSGAFLLQEKPAKTLKAKQIKKVNLQKQAQLQKLQKPTPKLNKIREVCAKQYDSTKRILLQTKRIPKVVPYRFRKCIDCDTKYLAELLEKDTFGREEFENLICINKPHCKNNAEFTEMFNEVIFMAMDKNPDIFFECYSNERYANHKRTIDQEIISPISDKINAKQRLQIAGQRLQKRSVNYQEGRNLQILKDKVNDAVKLRPQIINQSRVKRLQRN